MHSFPQNDTFKLLQLSPSFYEIFIRQSRVNFTVTAYDTSIERTRITSSLRRIWIEWGWREVDSYAYFANHKISSRPVTETELFVDDDDNDGGDNTSRLYRKLDLYRDLEPCR